VDGNAIVTGTIFGTVRPMGADCAEEFDVEPGSDQTPGTVMVIATDEMLRPCGDAYDRKVAGVLSGAGDYPPGIILGSRLSGAARPALALSGKVYCKVDADHGAIAVGDLLTTSSTPGHAMKAGDADRCHGAILGKALREFTHGRGLIPVLVAMH
jgi:hypothetical protein